MPDPEQRIARLEAENEALRFLLTDLYAELTRRDERAAGDAVAGSALRSQIRAAIGPRRDDQ